MNSMAVLRVAGMEASWLWLAAVGAFAALLRFVTLWRVLLELILALLLATYTVYRLISYARPRKVRKIQCSRRKKSKFRFLQEDVWLDELRRVELGILSGEQDASQYSSVNETLEEILNLTVSVFIESWYSNLSQNQSFQESLRKELKQIILALTNRLHAFDIPELLVIKLLPVLHQHFKAFARDSPYQAQSYTLKSKLKAVSSSGHQLHDAVSISANKDHTREKDFFRKKFSKILPLVLSSGESSNNIIPTFLREVLASSIFANVLDMATEGDFVNMMIVKFIGDNLQRRSQVKRLRAALEQHTRQSADPKLETLSNTVIPAVSGNFTKARYHHCLQFIELGSDLELEELGRQLEAEISKKRPDQDREERELLMDTKNRVLQKLRISSDAPSLSTILGDSQLRSQFATYLKQNDAVYLLEIHQSVNALRSPLSHDTGLSPDTLEFATFEAIRDIHQKYLVQGSKYFSDGISACIQRAIDDLSNKDNFERAKEALIELQKDVYKAMAADFYGPFSKSGNNMPSQHKLVDLFSADTSLLEHDDSQYDEGDTEKSISPTVFEAVEKSLEQIVNMKQRGEVLDASRNQSTSTLKNLMASLSSSSTVNLVGDMHRHASGSSIGTSHSGLFGSIPHDESDSDSEASDHLALSDPELSSSEILRAAPGDLSLSEKLATIDQDIYNLRQQNEILLPLLKKAELTNNMSEMSILKRSKQGLDREIASKELQRQHWIIQENENSLFGKSKIQISSYMSESKNGSEYVLYIVEVQKFSNDDPNEITAGWVVARRFSQFYQLNEYLKKRSPKVSAIKFPKKSVLNFQKKQLLEIRKRALEHYLQQLLTIPEVCSDPILRSFLSSENFLFGSLRKLKKPLEDILGSFSLAPQSQLVQSSRENDSPENGYLDSIREMQSELKQFDDSQRQAIGRVPFVKPISELLIDVFELGSSKSWIRGRALLIILQQVLGSAIEKKLRSSISHLLGDEMIWLNGLTSLRDTVYPGGRFKDPPVLRSEAQQEKTRGEARAMFEVFMEETCGKVFGSTNTKQRSNVLFELFQNDYFNKLLIFSLIEELIAEAFPELQHE